MENPVKTYLPRKTFRKLRKKERRKLKRQEKAKDEAAKLENDPYYHFQLRNEEAQLYCRLEREEEESKIQNQIWLERELTAQKEFAVRREELEAFERVRENAKRAQEEHLESFRKQRDEARRQRLARIETNIRRDILLQEQIEQFLNGSATIPDELLKNAESNPGREVCSYFTRTGCCRFGDPCNKNHIRPGISKILMISNFFDHIRLNHAANLGDMNLEVEDQELDEAFRVFFYDACHELEKFGTIEKFFVGRNPMHHLRGKAFVEYSDMREAVAALKAINGRFYGGKQLGVEFSGIQAWSQAICGYHFSGHWCSHGSTCNLIHCFKNPRGKYSIHPHDLTAEYKMLRKLKEDSAKEETLSDWDKIGPINTKKDWQWDASPENASPNTKSEVVEVVRSRKRSKSRSPRKMNSKRNKKSKS